jgi:hypothetical protein
MKLEYRTEWVPAMSGKYVELIHKSIKSDTLEILIKYSFFYILDFYQIYIQEK